MAEIFQTKVRRIGNSLGVIIPADLLDKLGYGQGETIQLEIPVKNQKSQRELLLDLCGTCKGAKHPFKRDKEDRF